MDRPESNRAWISSKKVKELKALYKVSPDDILRELSGITSSSYDDMFAIVSKKTKIK